MIAANYAALARELKFSQSALAKWKAQHADHPTSLDVDEWRAWIDGKGLGKRGHHRADSMVELDARKRRAEVRLLEIKIAKEERALIPANDVDTFLLFLASRLKSSLYQMFQTELPPKLAGQEVAEIRRMARESCDVLMLSMSHLQDEWVNEQARSRAAAVAATETAEATGE
jgi:hypothetical protein